MKKEEFKFRSTSNVCDIRAVRWIPDKEPIAILQISHGMVEFIDRYEDFAKFLCSKGFLVTGNDHLGHGESVNSKDDWGYFAEHNGNEYVLKDLHELTKITKESYPNLPYFFLGHSMGSFYARQYLCEYGNELDAAIVMGTGFAPMAAVKAGMAVCNAIALVKGWRYRSELVNNMACGSYNKKFEPARTHADWLTKDEKIVDWYVKEPKCSFLFTVNGYYNMFKGIGKLHDKKYLSNVPKELSILFVSGMDDPVGDFGKQVKESLQSLADVGVKDLAIKLYPNDRHEILNEIDRDKVYDDLYNWLEAKIK